MGIQFDVDALWATPEAEVVALYRQVRRAHAEKKFARDTERGRLNWLRARTFAAAKGGVTERQNAVDASDDLAKKGQHVRELTLEMDLLKCDVDAIDAAMRMRGMAAPASLAEDHGADLSATDSDLG